MLGQPIVVTLLTDFGASDYFVGAMKGVLLWRYPHATIVDLTHDVPPFDIEYAAYTLLATYGEFPPQTIHIAVVDPGVGSARRPLLALTRSYFFIAPDNGLLSYVCEREAAELSVYHITNENYFRQTMSETFHGRDVFAPVAVALMCGISPDELGAPVDDYIKLPTLAPRRIDDKTLAARIINIDRFGNCVTNITRASLSDEQIARGARLQIAAHEIKSFRRFFAESQSGHDEIFAYWGSAGFLEIAAYGKSAAKLLRIADGGLPIGVEVELQFENAA